MKQNTLGQQVAKLRKEKHWTQEELGEKLGVSAQAVSKWENGQALPDISLLPQIASLLDVSLDTLFDRKEELPVQFHPQSPKKDPRKMMIHIQITSSDNEIIHVNLPLFLVRHAVNAGKTNFFSVSGGDDAMRNIDWNQIFEMVDAGVTGKLIEIQTSDGDHIEIFIS